MTGDITVDRQRTNCAPRAHSLWTSPQQCPSPAQDLSPLWIPFPVRLVGVSGRSYGAELIGNWRSEVTRFMGDNRGT